MRSILFLFEPEEKSTKYVIIHPSVLVQGRRVLDHWKLMSLEISVPPATMSADA